MALLFSALAVVLALVFGKNPPFEPLLLLFSFAFLFLELTAVSLPGVGRFRGHSGLLIAAASGAIGPRAAALVFLLGVLLSGARDQFSARWRQELSTSALPPTLAVAVTLLVPFTWPSAGLGVLVFLLGERWVHKAQMKGANSKARGKTLRMLDTLIPLNVATSFGGLMLLCFDNSNWWYAGLLFPLLGVSHRAAENAVFRLGIKTATAAVEVSQAKVKVSKKAVADSRREQSRLADKVELLNLLVLGCRELAGDLESASVYGRLEKVLEQTIPHEGGAVLEYLGDGDELEITHSWSFKGLSPIPEGLKTVGERVASLNEALEVDDGATSGLPAPFDGVRSMLGFPVSREGRTVGVVLLVHRKIANFDDRQTALLGVLAVQAGITIDNARLYKNVKDGQDRLKESQSQLIQAEKMTAVGQLAAGVAHELNSPLAAISLSLEAIPELLETAPKAVSGLVTEALRAVDKSQKIVDQLLGYSRQESERERLDLSAVALDCLDFLGPKLRKDKVAVETDLVVELPVLAGGGHIQQILTNLILNACDASSSPAKIRVFSRLRRAWAEIGVEDWGHGIPKLHATKVFDPFFTSKPVGSGTGLGLTVSLQLAQQYGGELDFESKQSGGTIFYLRLPIKQL